MTLGMPILREHTNRKLRNQAIDRTDNLVPSCHGQSPAGTKVVLNVNDNEGFVTGTHVWDSFDLGLGNQSPPVNHGLEQVHAMSYLIAMFVVAALYKFTPFSDPTSLRGPLAARACNSGVKGTLLLADEGINGTIAGTREGIDTVLAHIRSLPGCADLEWKESHAETMPFARLKVRLKKEIVTMGQEGVDPTASVGTYVDPHDWNALISDPDVAVIDTRNDYEVAIGTFEDAVDPETASFRDFPAWWAENATRFEGKKIAMFCTGGIRCEKSTNWLIGQGVENVFHLKGGILKYLEEVPRDESLWKGECFVFDKRVSVGHGLELGPHTLCYACRRPMTEADLESPDFEEGVSCPACIHEYDEEARARFRERQKQIALSKARGERHLHDGKYDD